MARFDKIELENSFEGDLDILEVAIEDFCRKIPQYINVINEHFNKQDFESLKILAHTLKGLCATFQAQEIRQVCGQLENSALILNPNLLDQIRLLQQELPLLGDELTAYKETIVA